jgi:hypothetical protein
MPPAGAEARYHEINSSGSRRGRNLALELRTFRDRLRSQYVI